MSLHTPVMLDIGCGAKKQPGHVGLDLVDLPGVDHVVDFTRERLPFEDNSVDRVFSSHCLEHLESPNNIWVEISRVLRPGGEIEIWTPFPWHDDQHLIGHISPWGPARWRHLTTGAERHFYHQHFLAGGYWRWRQAIYCIPFDLKQRLDGLGMPVDFAIRHLVNVVTEWGCLFEYCAEDPGEHEPDEVYVHARDGERYPLHTPVEPTEPSDVANESDAVDELAGSEEMPSDPPDAETDVAEEAAEDPPTPRSN